MPESFTDQPIPQDPFDRGLALAVDHHRRQHKGTRTPYAAHLLAVTAIVLEMGGTQAEAIAALLHDAVEDGGGEPMLARIADGFGADVARMVLANSGTLVEPKPAWRARKETYIAAIADKDSGSLRVSLADKLHNAQSILRDYRVHGDALWTRFKPGQGAPVRWYYRALVDAFTARQDDLGPGAVPFLDELRRTVDELDRLAGPTAT